MHNFLQFMVIVILSSVIPVKNDLLADATKQKLPVLKNVGVIPLQLGSSEYFGLNRSIRHLKTAFPIAVRSTYRFHVLSDEIIKQMWSKPSTRRELIEDYEISAYFNLYLAVRGDAVLLIARILSPKLKPYIQEHRTFDRMEFSRLTYDMTRKVMDDLISILVNRIPVDVSVTSVQGPYVTLSGGMSQGIHLGDTVKFKRVWIDSIHPVTNYWRTFSSIPLGTAKVIEVKAGVSIAKMQNLIRPDDIQVGDGAKIQSTISRSRYARVEKSKPKIADDTILLPPKINESNLIPPRKEQLAQADHLTLAGQVASDAPATNAEGDLDTEHTSDDQVPSSQVDAEASKSEVALYDRYLPGSQDKIELRVGQTGWSFRGPGSSGSRLSWYLPMNSAGVNISRRLVAKFKYQLGGDLHYGKNQEHTGSYSGYDGFINLLYEDEWYLNYGLLESWFVGVQGVVQGSGVKGEEFGGYDAVQGEVIAGLMGKIHFANDEKSIYDWMLEAKLSPITLGFIGYDADRRAIRSSFGWQIRNSFIQYLGTETLEWGFGWQYGSQIFLDNDAEATLLNRYGLQVLARWRY